VNKDDHNALPTDYSKTC